MAIKLTPRQLAKLQARPAARTLRLELPYPPSVNRYWRTWQGRILISEQGRTYRLDVQLVALALGSPCIEGRLGIRIWLYPPDRRRRDCDNPLKGLLDSLTHAAVYADDSQIERLTVQRYGPTPGGRCVVRLWQMGHQRGLFED